MSRVYSVQFNNVAVTVQQDFFEIVAAAGKNVRILACFISQVSDAGDAQDEQLQILLKSGQTTTGSGGTAPTKVANNETDAAAGFTAAANNTTKASAGTIRTHHAEAFNVRAGFIYVPTEKMQIELTGSRRFTVELAETPDDELTMSGTLYVEEFG
jgi:hypothetical protein